MSRSHIALSDLDVTLLGAITALPRECCARMRSLGLHAGNVLLTSSNKSPHGFEAKISDFGLARDIGTATKLETRTYGTITHMAPEVLASDYISKVSVLFLCTVSLQALHRQGCAYTSLGVLPCRPQACQGIHPVIPEC